MRLVEEKSVGENFTRTDFPDGLPGRIKESVGEFFSQTDFPDILPGWFFLTEWVRSVFETPISFPFGFQNTESGIC